MSTALAQDELVADPWLAEQIGRSVYRLDVSDLLPLGFAGAAAIVTERMQRLRAPAMVYAKVPPDAVTVVAGLERGGFRLVDTNVTLEHPPVPSGPATVDGGVRLARPEDEQAVVALARRSFRFSRFHLDPELDDRIADEIKAQWVANFFRGRRGDRLIVADSASGVAGFLLALEEQDGTMVIDLVAVDEEQRGRGIAADMTRLAQGCFPGLSRMRVGTQLANTAALRAYQKLGFTVSSAAYVFHQHLSKRE
jgi:dTDP-4-amino-4,6-dideoxy-D-galactose acyltransferase